MVWIRRNSPATGSARKTSESSSMYAGGPHWIQPNCLHPSSHDHRTVAMCRTMANNDVPATSSSDLLAIMLNDLPPFLRDTLSQDQALAATVGVVLEKYKRIMSVSLLPFFPGYTDHGYSHVISVLQSVEWLVGKEDNPITSSDVAVLAIAAVLHDIALHITEDGFVSLIRPAAPVELITGLGDKEWGELWRAYISEAKRWDSRKRVLLFGRDVPIKDPPEDTQDFSEVDQLLIGEFIRRYHPRIAHETARFGFPAPGGRVAAIENVDPVLLDLAGLVARSHGMSLRATMPYLQKHADVRDYRGLHAVYVMVLLRIADFLQIERSRAPKEVLEIRNIRSPISRGEWRLHGTIDNVNATHEDNEAIFVKATPGEAATFLRVRGLLRDIQNELDTSWAVLGEVYGRMPPLHRLKMVLRRVRSNLDDEDEFERTISYVPREAVIKSAGADLLKLLIAPLYGDRPDIGVRELIQNGVDAVRELDDLDPTRARFRSKRNPDVLVELVREAGNAWLVVSDEGVGMSADTICNFFLNAGATFRLSDEWKRLHMTDSGHSKVLRSGRFGIGVLAAFILGDEIHVETRYVFAREPTGFQFSASITDDTINIQKVPAKNGTRIRVRLNESSAAAFEDALQHKRGSERKHRFSDWYCFSRPNVQYVGFDGKKIGTRWRIPSPDEPLPAEWRRMHLPELLYQVDWTYSQAPGLVVNGILVQEAPMGGWLKISPEMVFRRPNLSIVDPDAQLPLSIRRDALTTDELPFAEALRDDVICDYITHSLLTAPAMPVTEGGDPDWYLGETYRGFSEELAISFTNIAPNHFGRWLSASEGVCPFEPWFLRRLNLESLLILIVAANETILPEFHFTSTPNTVLIPADDNTFAAGLEVLQKLLVYKEPRGWNVATTDRRTKRETRSLVHSLTDPESGPLRGHEIYGATLVLPRTPQDAALDRFPVGIRSELDELTRLFDTEKRERNALVLQIGQPPHDDDIRPLAEAVSNPSEEWPQIAMKLYLREGTSRKINSPLASHWKKYMDVPVIPYGSKDRSQNCERAFESLRHYVEQYKKAP